MQRMKSLEEQSSLAGLGRIFAVPAHALQWRRLLNQQHIVFCAVLSGSF
jgi:hypothetical protein